MTVTIDAGETSTADLSAYLPLLARLRNGARAQPDWSALVDDAVQVWARPGFDTFLALPGLRFEPFDYQLQAARTVLRRMRGRGILADEVGLGKTIEAGLVLSELRMRGLADRAGDRSGGPGRPVARRTRAQVRVADYRRPIPVDTRTRHRDRPGGHHCVACRHSPGSAAGSPPATAAGRAGDAYDWPVKSAHLRRWVLGPGRAGVHAPPPPRVPLGPVGESLWRSIIPTFGLPAVLRCLAALWRLPDEGVFLDLHGSAAVAAAIERAVCHRANLTTGRFAEVAAVYRVNEAAIRAADADLQKCLQLGPKRWW